MKKVILSILCAAALALPLTVSAVASVAIKPQYDETFLGELRYKHERLCEIAEPKLILIGGSSLPFGIDSERLEEYVGMPVVDYGLYAELGTKAMLDLSRNHIGKGDIVIICPEVDRQTYSLFYSGMNMLEALDGCPSLLFDVGAANFGELIAALPEFASSKLDFYKSGSKPVPSGIYSLSSFDEYGDIKVERQYNIMPDYGEGSPIELSAEIITDEFVDYLNDYAGYAKRRGAKVWFSFPPMNEAAVNASDEEKADFCKKLGESLDFPVISGLDDYILDREFFYDTNFHLNSRGVLQRTALLAGDIIREAGMTDRAASLEWMDRFNPPKRPDDFFEVSSAEDDALNALDFVFEETSGGLKITGLSETGKTREVLTVPRTSDGKAVVAIGSGAFGGGLATVLKIPADSSLRILEDRAFENSSLRRIESDIAPDLVAASDETFAGTDGCYVYVSDELYGSYATDYFWSGLMEYVKRAE